MSYTFSVNSHYLMTAEKLNQCVNKNGAHFFVMVYPEGSDKDFAYPGYRLVHVGNGMAYNPITKQIFDLNEYSVVQRLHKDSVQYQRTADEFVDEALQELV